MKSTYIKPNNNRSIKLPFGYLGNSNSVAFLKLRLLRLTVGVFAVSILACSTEDKIEAIDNPSTKGESHEDSIELNRSQLIKKRSKSKKYIVYSSKNGRFERVEDKLVKLSGDTSVRKILQGAAIVVTNPSEATLNAFKQNGYSVEQDSERWRIPQWKGGSGQSQIEVTPGIKQIEADQVPLTGTGVRVCVVDSGIDTGHRDLAPNIIGTFSASSKESSPVDQNGHGTHVAGTIAAVSNGYGVVGVAPGAGIISVKGLNKDNRGSTVDLAEAIVKCVEQKADVINMSWGSSSNSDTLREAIRLADDRGIILVAAAGNDSSQVSQYPALYSEVICISAVDYNDNFASFSNYGSQVNHSAPGVNIRSTWIGGGYRSISGTSMATPHVVGTIALLLEKKSNLKRSDLIGEDIGLSTSQQGNRYRINAKFSYQQLD